MSSCWLYGLFGVNWSIWCPVSSSMLSFKPIAAAKCSVWNILCFKRSIFSLSTVTYINYLCVCIVSVTTTLEIGYRTVKIYKTHTQNAYHMNVPTKLQCFHSPLCKDISRILSLRSEILCVELYLISDMYPGRSKPTRTQPVPQSIHDISFECLFERN